MELWQMDVMGGVLLDDATELKVVTGIDDHSRFCVIAKLVERATARPVCAALLEGLSLAPAVLGAWALFHLSLRWRSGGSSCSSAGGCQAPVDSN
jgi:hypothetical protein